MSQKQFELLEFGFWKNPFKQIISSLDFLNISGLNSIQNYKTIKTIKKTFTRSQLKKKLV